MHYVETGRVISSFRLVRVHLIGNTRLIDVKSTTISPVESLENALTFWMPLDQLFKLLFNDYHISICYKAAHEVVCEISIPLLSQSEVKTCSDEVMRIICLLGKDHSHHYRWVILVQRTVFRCRLHRYANNLSVILQWIVCWEELTALLLVEPCQGRLCQF